MDNSELLVGLLSVLIVNFAKHFWNFAQCERQKSLVKKERTKLGMPGGLIYKPDFHDVTSPIGLKIHMDVIGFFFWCHLIVYVILIK